ncbi:MAG TPA: hypothetical protein VK364_04325, partial [Hymenobacter sp.]|nr:hypothetical protein [Hymenobacter sp.]
LLGGLLSCTRSPALYYQPPMAEKTAARPQLLFLSCRLSSEATGSRLEVVHVEAVPGSLKTAVADATTPDMVRVLQLNNQGKALVQVQIEHPLRRSIEHVANDQRTFERTTVVLPAAEFFVRLALQPTAVSIRIEEVIDGKTTVLRIFPIPS